MKLNGVTRKKSYLEHFLQRVRGKSPEEVSIRRIPNSHIKKVKKGILKPIESSKARSIALKANSEQAFVQLTPEKDSVDVNNNVKASASEATKELLPDSSTAAAASILRKQILEAPTSDHRSFSRMIQDYASAINLTEMERQCLGFDDHTEDGEESDDPRRASSSTLMSKWPYVDMNNNVVKGEAFPVPPEITINLASIQSETPPISPENISSTWDKISDAFSFKSWLGPTPTNEYETICRQKDDDFDAESDHDEPPAAVLASSKIPPHKILKSALLSLLEKACTGGHDNDNVKNCFKCQHKDGFRSLILNFIDEIRYIWTDRHLSSRGKSKRIMEVFEVWIYQLSEQNLSLTEAYSVSSRAADKLKRVLVHSRISMRHHQKKMDKETSMNDALTYELTLRDQTISKLKAQLEYESDKRREISKKLEETQTDVNGLTELIIRLRDRGIWDIHGLAMSNETFQKIFQSDYYLHGSKVIGSKEFSQKRKEWRNEIELLKSESDTLRQIIATKDKEIQRMNSAAAAAARTKNRIE